LTASVDSRLDFWETVGEGGGFLRGPLPGSAIQNGGEKASLIQGGRGALCLRSEKKVANRGVEGSLTHLKSFHTIKIYETAGRGGPL